MTGMTGQLLGSPKHPETRSPLRSFMLTVFKHQIKLAITRRRAENDLRIANGDDVGHVEDGNSVV